MEWVYVQILTNGLHEIASQKLWTVLNHIQKSIIMVLFHGCWTDFRLTPAHLAWFRSFDLAPLVFTLVPSNKKKNFMPFTKLQQQRQTFIIFLFLLISFAVRNVSIQTILAVCICFRYTPCNAHTHTHIGLDFLFSSLPFSQFLCQKHPVLLYRFVEF